MTRIIKATNLFKKQIKDLNKNSREMIHEKIELIKSNPYRFKKIHSKNFSKVFRVRFSIESKETRLIYIVIEPNIILICLLDRKGNYKDLEKYIKKAKKEI